MKSRVYQLLFCFLPIIAQGQQEAISPFNGRYWGVVLEHPDTKKITVKENIEYTTLTRSLRADLYLPLKLGAYEKRKTVVILNGIGDQANQPTLKQSPAQTSWARLLAANGFVVITMESEVNKVQESFTALFKYIASNCNQLHIDTAKLGVHAFSANCRETLRYIMSPDAPSTIKAAVLYYGQPPSTLLRDDLPVYFVIAEKDIRDNNYGSLWQSVLKNKSPWTLTIAPDMPHAFDFFSDSETSRRVILSTISFWNDRLNSLPPQMTPFSKEREIVAATYSNDQITKVNLMREWFREHPQSNDAYAFSAYATALMEIRDFAEAEKNLRKAIVLKPDDRGNYLTMAVISYALDKKEEGDRNLGLYEQGNTPEAFTYFYIADRLRGIKKFDHAALLYEQALKFPNPGPFVYYNLAICYANSGETDKAFQNLFHAADASFGTKEGYESDENLKGLHRDPRWQDLMKKF